MTDDQFERLPKYAKHEIRILRMRVEELRSVVQSYGDKTPTRIRWGYDHPDISENYGYIRDIETVFFKLREDRGMVRVRLVNGGEAVNVNTDDGVIIEPGSSNDFRIRLKD